MMGFGFGGFMFILMVVVCIWQSRSDEKKYNEQLENTKEQLKKEFQHEKELLNAIHENEKQELIKKYESKLKKVKTSGNKIKNKNEKE